MIKSLVAGGLIVFFLGIWLYLRWLKKTTCRVDLRPFGLDGYADVDRRKKRVIFVVDNQVRRYFKVEKNKKIKIHEVELIVDVDASLPIQVVPLARPTVSIRAQKI